MKHTKFLVISLLLFSASASAAPKEKVYSCAIKKTLGRHFARCTDKSETPLLEDAGQPVQQAGGIHIRDASGTTFDNMTFLSMFGSAAPVILNKGSGHVLSYDTNGEVSKITKVYFDGANCTGNAYAFPPDIVLKNKYLANYQAWPGGAQALKIIGFNGGVVTMLSSFQSDTCSVLNSAMAKPTLVAPASFDSSDPLTLALPLEIVGAQ